MFSSLNHSQIFSEHYIKLMLQDCVFSVSEYPKFKVEVNSPSIGQFPCDCLMVAMFIVWQWIKENIDGLGIDCLFLTHSVVFESSVCIYAKL